MYRRKHEYFEIQIYQFVDRLVSINLDFEEPDIFTMVGGATNSLHSSLPSVVYRDKEK